MGSQPSPPISYPHGLSGPLGFGGCAGTSPAAREESILLPSENWLDEFAGLPWLRPLRKEGQGPAVLGLGWGTLWDRLEGECLALVSGGLAALEDWH